MPYGELFLGRRRYHSLFALYAERQHRGKRDDAYHDGDDDEVGAHFLAEEHGGEQRGETHARLREYALYRQHRVALGDFVRNDRDYAVKRRVAEGVHRIPQHVRYRKPHDFRGLTYVGGHGEHEYRGEGYERHRYSEPRQEFMPALELDLVEYRAEYGVVHGVPHLDGEHDRARDCHIDALEDEQSG